MTYNASEILEKYEKKLILLGKIALIISILGIIITLVGIGLLNSNNETGSLLLYPANYLLILGLLLGGISYFGPFKNITGFFAFFLCLVFLMIIPFITAGF